MPVGKKRTEKLADQAKLKQLRRVVITLEASEEILQRLAALLTFASAPYELEEAKPLGPLPWEDPNDPRFVAETPVLQLDYNIVRKSIIEVMDKYLTAGGDRQKIVALLAQWEVAKLSELSNANLVLFHAMLNDLVNGKTPTEDT